MSNIQTNTAKNSARDYVEIGAAFLIIIGILFALGQLDLLPKRFGLSDTMNYGLVFIIGLVASVSSCIAVTGGLLVAAAAKYNEATAGLTPISADEAAYLFQCGAHPLLHAARRRDRGHGLGADALAGGHRCADDHRQRGHDPARVPDAKASARADALPADDTEGVRPLHSRPRRTRRQWRGVRPWRRDLLSAVRLHPGASALRAGQRQLHGRRADDAGVFARNVARAALPVGGLQPSDRQLPATFPQICRSCGHRSWNCQHPIWPRPFRERDECRPRPRRRDQLTGHGCCRADRNVRKPTNGG